MGIKSVPNEFVTRGKTVIVFADKGTFLVDSKDWKSLKTKRWFFDRSGYIVSKSKKSRGIFRQIRMHREIIGAKDGEIVDHANKVRHDNRRKNLRIVSHAQNMSNRNQHIGKDLPLGVTFCKPWSAYIVRVSKDNKSIFFGYFKNKEEAILVAENARKKVFGEYC